MSDRFKNWKNALCKTKGFRKYESLLCHKHGYYAQPGHIDEQLKGRLKSQKEENRNYVIKIVQSISYLSCQGIALHKSKQGEELNFKHLLQAEDDEVLSKAD